MSLISRPPELRWIVPCYLTLRGEWCGGFGGVRNYSLITESNSVISEWHGEYKGHFAVCRYNRCLSLHLCPKDGVTALCHVLNDKMRQVLVESEAVVNVKDKVRRWEDVSLARVWG